MNNTTTTTANFGDCISEQQGPIISTVVLGVLFIISETFPYLKSFEGNGIIQEMVALVRKLRPARQERTQPIFVV